MIYQISVFLENRAGQLAEVTNLLAENKINLRAISIAETTDYGVLRVIVDDAERASAILLEQGNVISMTPVSVVAVPDRPAGLSEILSVISDAGVDIEYMYSILASDIEKAYMVFRASDEAMLEETIRLNGMKLSDSSDLGIK